MGCDGRPSAPLPPGSWAPAESRRKDAAPGARSTATPYSVTPGLSPSSLTSAPSSPGLAAPRRGSHAPRARRAPGPRSAPPARDAPAPQPDRAGEEEQGEARRGWAGGDARGARGARGAGGEGRGPPRAAVPTPARAPAETPRGSSPGGIQPASTLHRLRDARHAAPDWALISALLPSHPFLQSYYVPHKPRRNCAFPSGSMVSLKEKDQKCPFRNRTLKLPATGGRSQRGAAGISLWTLTFTVARARPARWGLEG